VADLEAEDDAPALPPDDDPEVSSLVRVGDWDGVPMGAAQAGQ